MFISNTPVPTVHLAQVYAIVGELGLTDTPKFLMNRKRLAIPLRNEINGRLRSLASGEVLIADFVGVEEATSSVLSEIGPALFQEYMAIRTTCDCYFAYAGLTADIATTLDDMFHGYPRRVEASIRFTTVAFDQIQNGGYTKYRFIGERLPEALLGVLDAIYSLGRVTSNELEKLGIRAASRKLTEVYAEYPWLLRKTQEFTGSGSNAWYYSYAPICPMKAPGEKLA